MEVEYKSQQPHRTGSARRSPRYVEEQLAEFTSAELMQRSNQMTEVLKHLLKFSVPSKKNIR